MWSLGDLTYRIVITCINILFPPLAVAIIAGPGYDCLMNCFLFLLAILPSHIHGFYISCVYFHRRSKVRMQPDQNGATECRTVLEWVALLMCFLGAMQVKKGQYPG